MMLHKYNGYKFNDIIQIGNPYVTVYLQSKLCVSNNEIQKPIHFLEYQGFIHDIHPMGSTFVNALRLFLITT